MYWIQNISYWTCELLSKVVDKVLLSIVNIFLTSCTSGSRGGAVAYRGSPAPGDQCLHRRPPPPPRISTPPPSCHIGLHGWRLWGPGCAPRLVNPASASEGGGALGKNRQAKKKRKKGLQQEIEKKRKRGALKPRSHCHDFHYGSPRIHVP